MEIPKKVAQVGSEGKILQGVANLPSELDVPEATPYVISFVKYKENCCEICSLDSNKARKAIEVIKKIGTKVCSEADFRKYNIGRIPVYNSGEYKKLYNRLEEDIEIKEIKLQADARIFYFDIESRKTLFIVAITQNHLETDKIRR